jgi:tetratricopeptide (TPR) repeat protein
VHDLLEARNHLLKAGDTEDADQVTEQAFGKLFTWGAWDQATSLIHDTLAWLQTESSRQATWIGRLGNLAQARGDYEEAARQYQRSLDISERLGDQADMASSRHGLGILARDRGDYEEAARQYQRSLDIFERLGDQARMADIYHQLGVLAQERGDYEEAARQYQRALDIFERLGNPARMATVYSQLGTLEKDRGSSPISAITWAVKALGIRLRLGIPEARINLRRLAEYRLELGAGPFVSVLTQVADNTDLAETITSLLDQMDNSGDGTA